jgi:uncharacterized coiled-coil protein SlyX
MWLLNWLPDFVFHGMLVVGLLAIVASFVLQFIPFVSQYKIPIQVLGIILTVVAVWYEGGIAKDSEYKARIAEMELKISRSETAAAEANAKLAEQILKEQARIKDLTETNKKRLQELADQLNKQCSVNQSVIDILNDAARNRKEKTK